MAVGQPAVERLREFLRDLKPGARALLIAELERGLLRGEDSTGAELILTELRRSIRDNQSTSQRIGDHARLFFQPLEPFLIDEAPDHKHCGRIARSALEPIWLWLSNTIMPEEAQALSEKSRRRCSAAIPTRPSNWCARFRIARRSTFRRRSTRLMTTTTRPAGGSQAQVDAAVRFCAKVFGKEYASLLTKAADVASHGERKAARA